MALRQLRGNVRLLLAQCHSVRAVSQAASDPDPEPDQDQAPAVSPTFVNRNPRNLEQMALAVKDRGWKTVWPVREFYHRLEFSRTQHHVTAEVFSCSSPVPVLTCSTREWAVKRELPSTKSVVACRAVGEVLALRCKQAGITRMVYRAIPWTYRTDSVQSFRNAMVDGGVILNEPRRKFVSS